MLNDIATFTPLVCNRLNIVNLSCVSLSKENATISLGAI